MSYVRFVSSRACRGWAVAGLATLALACAPKEEPAETPAEPTPSASVVAPDKTADTASAAQQAPAVAGRVIHLDANGNRTARPAGAPLPAAASLNRSSAGLVQENSPVPGGGVMVNLQDRFRSFSTATVQSDGTVKVECSNGADCTVHDHSSDGKEAGR